MLRVMHTPVIHTTIKVDSRVRDRLARLARERGTTIGTLVAELADNTPTQEELDACGRAATAYVRERINPHLSDADLAAGERFWAEIEGGRLPKVPDLYVTRETQVT
jgi:predicted DNA-binding ribbon-helix-helix protein